MTVPTTFHNLYPADLCHLERKFWVLEQHCHYDTNNRWVIYRNGYAHYTFRGTPKGRYDFITTLKGEIWIARSNNEQTYSTHLGLSQGVDVLYAGTIYFGRSSNRGKIIKWDNKSGHYRPSSSYNIQAGLPIALFSN